MSTPEHRRCPRCHASWPPDIRYCPHDGASLIEAPESTGFEEEVLSEPSLTSRPPEVGQELGSYRLVSLLGEGGMGSVYLAEHSLLGRKVALKVLHPEFRHQPTIVQRFFKEAQAVNQIGHRSLIDILDFVTPAAGAPYLVMEYLEGEPLEELIGREAPLSPMRAIELALPAAEALVAVHDHGIVHRDLKPENIFCARTHAGATEVKLLDFGIAKFLATEEAFLKTQTGQLIGTPEYMAPEQIHGLTVDPRCDVYAFGIILYELLTGVHPFREESLGEVLRRQLETQPEAPAAARGAQSLAADPAATLADEATADAEAATLEQLDELALRCLEKDREARPQTMQEVADRLRQARGDPVPVRAPDPRHRTKKPGIAWLAAGLAVIALGLGGYVLWSRSAGQGTREGSAPRAASSRSPLPTADAGPARESVPLRSTPRGAEIYEQPGGRFLGRTPSHVTVSKTGETELLLRLSGHEAARVSLRPGQTEPVRVRLRPRPARRHVRPLATRPRPARGRPERPRRRRLRRRRLRRRLRRPPRRRRARPRRPARPRTDVGTVNPFGEP